ncbi:MAG TPA: erythromycin esterase family protein, partial [Sphingomonadaceae bacterium]|nr:erythromycin esterase family protein [Sphingomonadaceae bacterium]
MAVHSPLQIPAEDLSAVLRAHGEVLPSPDTPDFGAAFDRFGDARIVLLGEGTHGTHEFYAARAQITRRLIERHGFNIVAVEGDWPDVTRIDDYVRHGAPRPMGGEPFTRFPTWMWRNQEVLAFADWLRGHNAALPEGERAAMRGLDVYSLRESIHAVIAYLEEHCPEEAGEARRRYGCLTPWQDEPQHYGRAVHYGQLEKCEDTMVTQLNQLLVRRMELIADHGGGDGEAFFDAEQNARIVRAAERYYRAMYRGAAESWNLRDRHMFD